MKNLKKPKKLAQVTSVISPIKSIRIKCLECSGGQSKEVKDCVISDCSLYPFRMGKNPNRAGIGNIKGCFRKKTSS